MMDKNRQLIFRIIFSLILFLFALIIIQLKINRNRQRMAPLSIKWPSFSVRDVSGKMVYSKYFKKRVRYVQFIGTLDDNNLELLENVYSNWSHLIDIIIFIKKENLRDLFANRFPQATIITEKYDDMAKVFKSSLYGKHYVFDKNDAVVISEENSIRYENSAKKALNMTVLGKQFRLSEHIRESENIDNLPEFKQVANFFRKRIKGYLLVGMIYSFCESCESGYLINMLKSIYSHKQGKLSAILLLSKEFEKSDIEIMKSQLRIGIPILIADEALSRKWQEWINEYSRLEANVLTFLIDPDGKIIKVLEPLCASCEIDFWKKIQNIITEERR